ncbi:hypothetical protein ABZ746_28645 [Streptomyces sp. NPDC020096]
MFRGMQYISLEKLIWLVRAVMSYDVSGQECDPPGLLHPSLKPWRDRWNKIEALREDLRQSGARTGVEPGDPTAVEHPARTEPEERDGGAEAPRSPEVGKPPEEESAMPRTADDRRTPSVTEGTEAAYVPPNGPSPRTVVPAVMERLPAPTEPAAPPTAELRDPAPAGGRAFLGLRERGASFEGEPPGLVARLVGLQPGDHRAVPFEHRRDLPFVVLTGGRGLGKSTVLATLRGSYHGSTPVALVDCEDAQFVPPDDGPHESSSRLQQVLLTIAEQLTAPVAGFGRIAFPRLMLGLVATTVGSWVDADPERIRREILRIVLLNDGGSRITGVGRWAERMAAKVTATVLTAGPSLANVIEATLEGLASRSRQKASVWYGRFPSAGGNAQRALVLLGGHFSADGASREHAERQLVRALLADLADVHSGVLPRLRRPSRPLVMVDNAHSAPGGALIDAVLRERSEGIADQVVFIAAVRGTGHPALRNAVHRTLPEVARQTGWTPDPASRVLALPLPPLSPDDSLHLVDAVCDGVPVPPRLPYLIHRLTGGNPLAVTLLARSVRENPSRATALRDLLTTEVRLDEEFDSIVVHQLLLDRLVHDGHLEALTVLAAAQDRNSARALAASRLIDDFDEGDALALQVQLTAEGLSDARGQLVGNPFVRTLLLLRLHDLDADHERWLHVHHTLVDHYSRIDDGTPKCARHRLHHHLALGDTERVVTYLRDTFHSLDMRTWLGTLLFVTSTPRFQTYGDFRAEIALGHADKQWPLDDPDAALYLRIRRILHAVWQLTDPLVLPDPKVRDRLRFELERLTLLRGEGNALLWRVSQDWPSDSSAGRSLRVPDDD